MNTVTLSLIMTQALEASCEAELWSLCCNGEEAWGRVSCSWPASRWSHLQGSVSACKATNGPRDGNKE